MDYISLSLPTLCHSGTPYNQVIKKSVIRTFTIWCLHSFKNEITINLEGGSITTKETLRVPYYVYAFTMKRKLQEIIRDLKILYSYKIYSQRCNFEDNT